MIYFCGVGPSLKSTNDEMEKKFRTLFHCRTGILKENVECFFQVADVCKMLGRMLESDNKSWFMGFKSV
jgi:prophage antirepressor-like protein